MKTIILLLAISISSFSYGQKLVLKPTGFEPVVYQIDSLKAPTIYKRAMDWVQITYKNPKESLKASIENENIRLDGFTENAFIRTFKSGSKSNYGLFYTLEINIKDGKYRFVFTPNQIVTDDKVKIFRFGIPDFFDGKADVNGNTYEGCASTLETSTNALAVSLYNYILGKKDNNNW
jgi:hypothetical protein